MKNYDVFFFRRDILIPKRDAIKTAYEEADDAERLACRIYDNMDESIYNANAAYYDKIVKDASDNTKRLLCQLASLEDAIIYADKLMSELEFLEGENVL